MHTNCTNSNPRVVSLVPSWTETLLAANINVVGRTRFCIHPAHQVQDITIVGGTKTVNEDAVTGLHPDFVIVDKQENTREMADQLSSAKHNLLVTDITDFKSLESSLIELSSKLKSEKLALFADRYRKLKDFDRSLFFKNIVLHGNVTEVQSAQNFEYVIWQKPFMVVGCHTFIAENFRRVGIELVHKLPYPEISEAQLLRSFCLFSSEPYPFAKQYAELIQRGFKGVVVDGEKLSWFGIRNLLFLEASQATDL